MQENSPKKEAGTLSDKACAVAQRKHRARLKAAGSVNVSGCVHRSISARVRRVLKWVLPSNEIQSDELALTVSPLAIVEAIMQATTERGQAIVWSDAEGLHFSREKKT